MVSRRVLLFAAGVLVPGVPALAAGDFWNHEEPANWTEDQKKELLKNSPWAKQTTVSFHFGGPRGGYSRSGFGIPGKYPGGPPDIGSSRKEQAQVLVRWESAKPVLEAQKKALPADASGYYVISMTGFPVAGPGSNDGFDDDRDRSVEGIKGEFSLHVKGQTPLYAAKVEGSPGGGNSVMLIYFSREGLPLLPEDKEVTFETDMGPLSLKVKFPIKEMVYRGKLEL